MTRQIDLGSRMKKYEAQSESTLLECVPMVARMDGRAFHTFTRGLARPYDRRMSALMVMTAKYLVEETHATIGYTQSDEISLVWINDDWRSEPLFGGRVQKLTSILGSLATAYFNTHLAAFIPEKAPAKNLPLFDARVFSVPNLEEAANYLLWRERDATKNSISMAAQSVFSHGQLHQKNTSDMQEMLFQKGINWNDYPDFFKKGSYVRRQVQTLRYTPEELEALPEKHAARKNPNLEYYRSEIIEMTIPPLSRIYNQIGVLFHKQEPLRKETDIETGD